MGTGEPRPNILLIVSDEERRNDWLTPDVQLPAHERLRADGLEFTRHYTHTSPCSPARASLYTGRYLPQHRVVDNVNFPEHQPLDPAIPTVGRLAGEAGYDSAYLGKWHLWPDAHPDLERWGYSGWHGNDHHFMGGAWTGRYFDPVIADQADDWLRQHAGAPGRPWFLTVALVGPHDVMWYPVDQPEYQAQHPDDAEVLDAVMTFQLGDFRPPRVTDRYPERFDRLPANFADDLHTKPEVQRAWRWVRNREHFVGLMDLTDERLWLRQLDYYAWLHEELDRSVARLLATLDELDLYDDTAIIYTSDHGDACGSHGLRAKLPCVYEEVMGVPLIVKVPGVTPPGRSTGALSTHVDLASTIAALAGVDVGREPSLRGVDLAPTFADQATSVRDHVLFAQDSAQSDLLRNTRYAVRGFFDGETKYARYYGVGGGIPREGLQGRDTGAKVFDVDADFDDQDHEWYRAPDDPDELVNLANDRSRRRQLREHYARLLEFEAEEFVEL